MENKYLKYKIKYINLKGGGRCRNPSYNKVDEFFDANSDESMITQSFLIHIVNLKFNQCKMLKKL